MSIKREILSLFCLCRICKPKQDSGSIAVYVTIIHNLPPSQSVLLFFFFLVCHFSILFFCVIAGSDGVFPCQVLILSKVIKMGRKPQLHRMLGYTVPKLVLCYFPITDKFSH